MKLLDLCDLIVDCEHKTAPKSSTGYPSIRTPNVGRGRLILDGVNRVDEETYTKWTRRATPRENDLIIAREAPVGNVALIRKGQKVCLGQRTVLVRPNPSKVDPEFLCYFLLGDYVQGRFLSAATGATVPHLNMSDIRSLPIPELPDRNRQRWIATTLAAYDDLIENNTRRIEILEEMARRLYEEWFVQFRFPGHEGVEFKESELGLIPEGWVVSCLGDIAEEIREAVHPSSVSPDTPYIGLEHLPRRSITLREWGSADSVSSGKLFFRRGDVLFGKIRPYFHKVVIAPFSGICSSDTILIRPKKDNFLGVVLCCSSSDKFVDYATQTSNGTKMPRADWKVLKNYPVLIPSDGILSDFNGFVLGVVGQARNLMLKNVNLRAQRDLLLPKLISGEIDVSDIPMPT